MAGFTLSFETLKDWCERQSFQFMQNDELQQLAIVYQILEKDAPLVLIPRPDRGMVTFAMTLPFDAPKERHEAVADALTYLNSSSYMGAWVLDRDTGNVAFRLTVATRDIEYGDAGIVFLAQVVVGTAEAVAERLHKVIEGEPPASVLPPQPVEGEQAEQAPAQPAQEDPAPAKPAQEDPAQPAAPPTDDEPGQSP